MLKTSAGDTFSEDELAAGVKLFVIPASFLLSVADIDGLPDSDRVEVAFAGRSNVGKSSLLNALTGRKALARVSNTPGRTQLLNFFCQGEQLYLVDMPGYGYARASKSAISQWTKLVFDYLRGRAVLKRVFLLIDARHGIKDADDRVMSILDEAAVSYQAVLTKIDKVESSTLERLIETMSVQLSKHGAAHPHILATSSRQRRGVDELSATISSLISE